MTHRKVGIRDKNAYLTLVPSESSRQADSYSMSHSWLPTTDVVCATSTSRVPIESSLVDNQKFVQKSGVPLSLSCESKLLKKWLEPAINKRGSHHHRSGSLHISILFYDPILVCIFFSRHKLRINLTATCCDRTLCVRVGL